MTCHLGKVTTWLVAVAMAVGCVSAASAQVFTGRVEVTVEDSTGGRLPGVNVDLTGPINQTQVTDAQGQARFLNLPVGTYAVKASLQGFNAFVNNTVQVVSGAATPISAKLGVAGTAETVNVTAATPVIDLKRDTTTTNVTLDELQNIPSSRDPWAVMQTVPTVYMDRVNVGGAESGQQSNYNAKGANEKDNTWAIDGVPVTDMGATGSSAFYYDFDSFQEMAVTTGGADAQNATGGVQLNMVLRKGTNKPSGDARIYFENDSLQAVNISPELAAALGNTTGKGNRTDKYQDYGFDLGGPLLKDRLWAWGTHRQDRHQPADADQRLRQHDLQELRVQGRRRHQPGDPRQLHVLREQQDQERPQRRPDCVRRKRRGIRPARRSTSRVKATSSSARSCSRRRSTRTSTAASSSRRKAASARTTTSTTAAWRTTRSTSTRATVRRTTSAATPATSPASTR